MKNKKYILPLVLAIVSLIGLGFLSFNSIENRCMEEETTITGCKYLTSTNSFWGVVTQDLNRCIELNNFTMYGNHTKTRLIWNDRDCTDDELNSEWGFYFMCGEWIESTYESKPEFEWITKEVCVKRKLKFKWD